LIDSWQRVWKVVCFKLVSIGIIKDTLGGGYLNRVFCPRNFEDKTYKNFNYDLISLLYIVNLSELFFISLSFLFFLDELKSFSYQKHSPLNIVESFLKSGCWIEGSCKSKFCWLSKRTFSLTFYFPIFWEVFSENFRWKKKKKWTKTISLEFFHH